MVKFILTEEQIADVLLASQKISGYVRNIETILAENAELYTEPKPQPKQQQPSFKEALQVVFSNPEFTNYIQEQIEGVIDNQDPEDLCELDIDESGSRVTIDMNTRWDAGRRLTGQIMDTINLLSDPDSYEFSSVIDRCLPKEKSEEEN
jgi:hypothetical protein